MKDWINNMDEKLDSMGAKLAKKEITIPTDLVAVLRTVPDASTGSLTGRL